MSAPETSRKRSLDEVDFETSQERKRSRTQLVTPLALPQQSESTEDPVIIASAPRHKYLWDRLPFGTLFEVARLSYHHDIDLESIPREQLNPLYGTNCVGIQKLRSVLGISTSTHVMDSRVAAELDWEADCVVRGNGEMLEHRQDSQPRSGRVFFSLGLDTRQLVRQPAKRSNSTVSSTSGKISGTQVKSINKDVLKVGRPRLEGSCLFTRVFGSHRFLRIKLLDRLSAGSSDDSLSVLFNHMLRPIYILGRVFRPLIEKEGTVVYYLEGPDYVGYEAEKPCGTRPGFYGLGIEIPNVAKLVNWWIPLKENRETLICKLATRLHLGLSETRPGLFMEAVMLEEDIMRDGVVFTDGCGMISKEAAVDHYHKCAAEHIIEPSAYQIRLSTAKGVVQVAPPRNAEEDKGKWIAVTCSMLKAIHGPRKPRSGPINGMHILDAAHYVTCVVKAARYAHPARLSKQLIPILCNQGVPEKTIRRLQEIALNEVLSSLANPLIEMKKLPRSNPAYRMHQMTLAKAVQDHASLIAKIVQADEPTAKTGDKHRKKPHIGREEWQLQESLSTTIVDNPETAAFSADASITPYEGLYLAVSSGFDILTSCYFTKLWERLTKRAIMGAIAEFHVPVPGSAYCMMLPDFTGELPEGYISFTPPEIIRDSTGRAIDFTCGPVLVGRHPALLPTDVRKVEFANIPRLRDSTGVVFCSTKGSRPLADMLAGGDYDGDEIILIWEQSLVEQFENADIALGDKPPGVKEAFERDSASAQHVLEQLDQLEGEGAKGRALEKYLMASLKVPILLGKYNTYYLQAVEQHGIASVQARTMAYKFNILLDAPKTAHRLTVEARLADRQMYDIYEKPYFTELSTKHFHQKSSNAVKKPLQLPNGHGVLSNLAYDGMKIFKKKLKEIREDVRMRNSIAQYTDLTLPWMRACQWAKGNASKTHQLELVETVVKDARSKFFKIVNNTKIGSAERQIQILQLRNWFASNPPVKDIPLLTELDGGSFLDPLRASYGYHLDYPDYTTGNIHGFVWQIALTPLLGIVADKSNPVRLPWDIFKRYKPHPAFCVERSIHDHDSVI